jgi:hypothetical protein
MITVINSNNMTISSIVANEITYNNDLFFYEKLNNSDVLNNFSTINYNFSICSYNKSI